jgi:hypothetical protein
MKNKKKQTMKNEELLEVGFTSLTPKCAHQVIDETTLHPGDHIIKKAGKTPVKHGIVRRSSFSPKYLDIAFSQGESIGIEYFSSFSKGDPVFLIEYEEYNENNRVAALNRVNILLLDAGIFSKYQRATGNNRNNLALLCINGPQETGEMKHVHVSK